MTSLCIQDGEYHAGKATDAKALTYHRSSNFDDLGLPNIESFAERIYLTLL